MSKSYQWGSWVTGTEVGLGGKATEWWCCLLDPCTFSFTLGFLFHGFPHLFHILRDCITVLKKGSFSLYTYVSGIGAFICPGQVSFFVLLFLRFYISIHERHRGKSRLPLGSPMWDSISGPRDHTLSQRQLLNHWDTYASLMFLFSKWRITFSKNASFCIIILHKNVHRNNLPCNSLIPQTFILSLVSKALGQRAVLESR